MSIQTLIHKCLKQLWFIIAKRWKQPKCPSTGKGINEVWYAHGMTIQKKKKNGIPTHTTSRINLKHYAMEEACHKQPNVLWLHLYGMYMAGKSIDSEADLCLGMSGDLGGLEGYREWPQVGTGPPLEMMKNVPQIRSWRPLYSSVNMLNTLNYVF